MAHDLDLRDNKHASRISFHQSQFICQVLVSSYVCLPVPKLPPSIPKGEYLSHIFSIIVIL